VKSIVFCWSRTGHRTQSQDYHDDASSQSSKNRTHLLPPVLFQVLDLFAYSSNSGPQT
jgi:hypothetical protein